MRNTIIYLLGFPGVGKYTIAKAICATDSDFRLVDNHLINNPVFSLIHTDGKTPLPNGVWDNIAKIWDAVLDTITHISPQEYSFVLTNALGDISEEERAWFNRVMEGAKTREATFIPVRLHCSVEENERRIVRPDRADRMKETDPESPKRNAGKNRVITTDHPNVLNLDVTDLSAQNAAKAILDHAESCH